MEMLISDTLVSLLLPVASGDRDWRSNQLPGIMLLKTQLITIAKISHFNSF